MALCFPATLPTLVTTTGRFILAPFSADDVNPLARTLADDDIWSQGYADGETRPYRHKDLVDFVHRRYDGHLVFSIFYTGLPRELFFIGTTGITDFHCETERVKIGRTVISSAFWGAKVNHELKLALLEWLFSCGAGRIECDVDPRNQRSLTSLSRFGFTVEGTRRRSSQRADGSWRDIVMLSLLREEWASIRVRTAESATPIPCR
jgi:RimJ/RimL family protein N-acetyltransferase